ncbi:right-handed parallel beta-helix repeat-containing protein [Kitasatospora sp. NPDC085879]|uniref:right-handed parallel beta-helix repeat-containing protein n=1 Tax=Kitasatospora sp. NPDC085879 TaxID=3154769 RepID=UPI003434B3A8
MSHRRLMATAAVLAAGVALIPGPARAADSPRALNGSAATGGSAPVGAGNPAFRTFSSPASKAVPAQRAALPGQGELKPRNTTAGRTVFVDTYCYRTDGDGTEANPYCDLQKAVDAAVAGDTIEIGGAPGSIVEDTTVVRTSGISLVGVGSSAWLFPHSGNAGKPALVLDGVSNVTVSNLMLQTSNGGTAVEIKNSSDITLDSSYVAANGGGTSVAIDGSSRDVTVSRTYLHTGNWSATGSGVSVAEGAKSITLAGDILAATGIRATGVAGLNVANNTVQRGCTPALAVDGASTGVFVENNLFEDANAVTDAAMGGHKAACLAGGKGWAPDVTVSAESAPGTTADYNAFYIDGANATAPYGWSGTTYGTLDEFRAGVAGQGGHDLVDPKKPNEHEIRFFSIAKVDYLLQNGSASIGTANPAAPGRPSSDFFGATPFNSRGAAQPTNPGLSLGLTAEQISGHAVRLTVDSKSAGPEGRLDVYWGDGRGDHVGTPVDGTYPVTHTYEKIGSYTVEAHLRDSKGNTLVNTLAVVTAGSDYTAYGPTRVLDTREGVGASRRKVGPFGTVHLKVGGNEGIPQDATAVVMNLTVTSPTAPGFITAYPYGGGRPTTSNVNYVAGQTVPNLAVVPVGSDGYVELYNGSNGTVDLVADIAGYFTRTAAGGYTPTAPTRLVDTRSGFGVDPGKLSGSRSFEVRISGTATSDGYVPYSGVSAVALNVTVTGATAGGFLTAYPSGRPTPPVASNLNYAAGQTIANAVVVPVGPDGKIRIYNGSPGATDVVVDVVGYYSTSSTGTYLPVQPQRLLDTRARQTPLDRGGYVYLPLSTGDPGITAYTLNATVTRTTGSGYLTVSPDPNSIDAYRAGRQVWPAKPLVSTLNWERGQTVPNMVQAAAGANGIVDLWNSGTGTTDLVVDISGYYDKG